MSLDPDFHFDAVCSAQPDRLLRDFRFTSVRSLCGGTDAWNERAAGGA